jgi:3-deoxy-D-manno-octulosonate 8-phosphate phosphatase (KDO 8-P phosphatase)
LIDERAADVRLLILDVDGVMTDGRIVINDRGEETKFFHVRDGQGLRLLMKAGVDVAIVTGRKSKTVEIRAAELGITNVFQGVADKRNLGEKLIKEKGLKREQVCCIGDDIIDIQMFSRVGLPVAVEDAPAEVCDAAVYVTKTKGGKGAVREVCEIILKAKGLWQKMVSDLG